MTHTASHKGNFMHRRSSRFLVAIVATLAAYAVGSRALDTGSLGQYGLTFLLLFIAGRYFYKTVRPS